MMHEVEAPAGWIVSGFQAVFVLTVWCALVMSYGIYRSVARPEPDPIRPSGPVD